MKHLRLREQRRQPLQKFSQKAPQPTALKPPSTARTAGRSDRAERRFRRQPFILLSFSSSKKARKAQETQSYQRFQCIGHTDFKTSGTNGSRSFQGDAAGTHATRPPNRAHSGSQGETRGVLDGGGITTLGAFCAVRKPCAAGCQNGKLCRFWALVGSAPEKRREPAEQRCAHARRCSEASRPRRVALLHCCFLRCTGKLRDSLSLRRRAERKIC